MPRRVLFATSLLALALLAGACASPSKLARQSDRALEKGDVDKAYDRALRAIQKDGHNAEARAAYDHASDALATQLRSRIRFKANAGDSLGAAESALEYSHFRADVLVNGSQVHDDAAWGGDEARLYRTAAQTWYRRGRDAMAAAHPKTAYRAFADCRRFLPGYADAAKLQDVSFRRAARRAAVVPFADAIGVRDLALETHERTATQVEGAARGQLTFTTVLPADSVEAGLTLSAARNMTREDAIAAGRRLGVNYVVFGRFSGLRSSTDTREFSQPVIHRVDVPDTSGHTRVVDRQVDIRVITRSRTVRTQTDLEVIDVKNGVAVAKRTIPNELYASVIWTDYRPEGDCSRYMLMSPESRKADATRARQVDSRWRETAGSWSLPALLERSKNDHDRARYKHDYRGEFYGDTRSRPVWLGELPSDDELAFAAVHDVWKPVFEMLQDVDDHE